MAVITNEAGAVVERLAYDAWGKRRFPNGADDPAGSIESQTTRGFTGHEQLDDVALVHMNGRVYDPLVGRMISADPTVPDPLNAQAWNRYSYVGNDPLAFTDPSGFSWLSSFFHSVGNFFRSILQIPIVRAVVQIVVTAVVTVASGGTLTIAAAALTAAASAAVITGLSGGNLGAMLKSAAIAGATAAAFFQVGDWTGAFDGTLTPFGGHGPLAFGSDAHLFNTLGHAAVGCLSAVASGGRCESGAAAAGIGAFAGPAINTAFPNAANDNGQYAGAVAAHGLVGGLASVAGGGKFENGAVTAAFGYMYNQAAHSGNDPNERHQMGVDTAMRDYVDRGYSVIRQTAVAVDVPGFATPRYYDFIAYDPTSNVNIGVEVKTTLYDTIRLNADQVAKDVIVMQQGGYSRLLDLPINGVGYATYCWGCTTVDFRSTALRSILNAANIPFTHGGRPGEIRP